MGVLMQAFYWDCPREEGREHAWWSHVATKVDGLAEAGVTGSGCRRRSPPARRARSPWRCRRAGTSSTPDGDPSLAPPVPDWVEAAGEAACSWLPEV